MAKLPPERALRPGSVKVDQGEARACTLEGPDLGVSALYTEDDRFFFYIAMANRLNA